MSAENDNHGQTPAAWTTVIIIMLAFVVGTLGVMLGNWVMFWVGVGMVVLAVVIGKVMQSMGLGAPGTSARDRRLRDAASPVEDGSA
ncbi:MAG: HGxxPAAW family protein [bacterium]